MRVHAALLALALFLAAAPVRAGDLQPLPEERLHLLTQTLDHEALHAKIWTWGWVGVYGAATIVQLALLPFTPNAGDRTDLWVGSASALIGALGIAFVPLNISSSAGLPSDPDAALAEVERRIAVGAEGERLATAWYTHVANFGVNLALGLILGLGFHRWESAAISFGVGFVVGEVTIFTVPTRLTRPEMLGQAPVVTPRGAGLAIAW